MTPDPMPAVRSQRPEWSAKAMLVFALVLAFLTAIGLVSLLHHPAAPSGLPDDPAVAAAAALVGERLEVNAGDLRFASSFDDTLAEIPPPSAAVEPDSARHARLKAALGWLAEGRGRHPLDPRYACLQGHLELAGGRPERAEGRYREALLLAPRYGEARLGLGLALARRAELQGDERTARALTLAAIAQFAAVEDQDRFYSTALYDRVLLLANVGRMSEARRWAERHAQQEPGSVWTAVLLRRVATP